MRTIVYESTAYVKGKSGRKQHADRRPLAFVTKEHPLDLCKQTKSKEKIEKNYVLVDKTTVD